MLRPLRIWVSTSLTHLSYWHTVVAARSFSGWALHGKSARSCWCPRSLRRHTFHCHRFSRGERCDTTHNGDSHGRRGATDNRAWHRADDETLPRCSQGFEKPKLAEATHSVTSLRLPAQCLVARPVGSVPSSIHDHWPNLLDPPGINFGPVMSGFTTSSLVVGDCCAETGRTRTVPADSPCLLESWTCTCCCACWNAE